MTTGEGLAAMESQRVALLTMLGGMVLTLDEQASESPDPGLVGLRGGIRRAMVDAGADPEIIDSEAEREYALGLNEQGQERLIEGYALGANVADLIKEALQGNQYA